MSTKHPASPGSSSSCLLLMIANLHHLHRCVVDRPDHRQVRHQRRPAADHPPPADDGCSVRSTPRRAMPSSMVDVVVRRCPSTFDVFDVFDDARRTSTACRHHEFVVSISSRLVRPPSRHPPRLAASPPVKNADMWLRGHAPPRSRWPWSSDWSLASVRFDRSRPRWMRRLSDRPEEVGHLASPYANNR